MDIKDKNVVLNNKSSVPLDYKNFDYEFLFKINDDIICQRLFDIRFFDNSSIRSFDLKYAIDEIVELINDDLKSKTRIYMFNMCYSRDNEKQEKGNKIVLISGVRGNGEEVIVDYNDMWVYLEKSPEFIPIKNEKSVYETYLKNGFYTNNKGEKTEVTGFYNRPKMVNGIKTYLHDYENQFSFSFKIKGKPVITKIWSADDYPTFVRSSVDIANKKVYIGVNESQSSYELRKKMFENREDLIPKIISIFRDTCSKVKF